MNRTEDGDDVSQNFERALQQMGAKVSFFIANNEQWHKKGLLTSIVSFRQEEPLVVRIK